MRKLAVTALLTLLGSSGSTWAQTSTPHAPTSPPPVVVSTEPQSAPAPAILEPATDWSATRAGRFASDRAFPGFIGPISNPVLAKDPRSLTEARFLFINNELPSNHALGEGDFQVYALQLRLALSERLTLIADKDGIADIHTNGSPDRSGWLDLNFGFKYLLVRDAENQLLGSFGITYEPPSGEAEVFQHQGDGVLSIFTTWGKEVACNWHVVNTLGYQFGFDDNYNSSFLYNSLHIDRQLFGWLYPLAELNWFHYTQGGHHGLPSALGEGDGLLNLGTSGVSGNDLVTVALGLKARLGDHAETGFAWEIPISNRQDLIDNRLTFEFILRY